MYRSAIYQLSNMVYMYLGACPQIAAGVVIACVYQNDSDNRQERPEHLCRDTVEAEVDSLHVTSQMDATPRI
jgi:hypothetical protein